MPQPPRRRFDATWLPFGMMIGFTVGIGFGLAVLDNLFLGALCGFGFGAALGIALGFRGRATTSMADEDAEDDDYRRRHGDPPPQGRSDDR